MKKTNAMRILDDYGIPYEAIEYDGTSFHSGMEVASITGEPANLVYKTLVTHSKDQYFVFVIPSNGELDLKKGAEILGVKKLEMLPVKDLLHKTGYIKGGCTSIGMKKQYPTFFHQDAKKKEYIYISGGKRGIQLKLNANDLKNVMDIRFVDVLKE
ncbi:MAG: Cys-tRNA(Pro) deacylase [Tissierellia bacterium]|nr:Cys-tRNA(Pro) deacylase [Tissierellia bacterium]